MIRAKRSATYLKSGLYLLVVILVDVAGITLFARFDLTRNGIFSLSGASQRAVSSRSP